jgi:hypothetical protein
MKLHLRFLAFALGTGLAFAAPTAAQAQVSVGVNIGLPAWGPPVPQGTQYYYIPEIDGYYDIYNGIYIVFDGYQWVQTPYLDGYDPYYFHPYPVSYVGAQPWLYISTYRSRYPQYVAGFRRGGYGNYGRSGHDYGAGRVYGYDHGGYNGRGNYPGNNGRSNYNGGRGDFDRNPGNSGRPGFPNSQPNQGQNMPGRGNRTGGQPGGFPGGQSGPGRGGFGGGQPGGNPGGRHGGR